MLSVGDKIPEFTLEGVDASGVERSITISEFSDKNIVVYFYPKDNTPGCTKEACGFRDKSLTRDDTVVVGISTNSVNSHMGFRSKYGLNFALMSDPEKEVASMFGAVQEGKASASRQTFLIKDGVLVKEWRTVKVDDHMDKVFEYISKM